MSYLKVIVLVEFLSNSCLYELNLGGTEVISVEINKISLLLFVAALGTVYCPTPPLCAYIIAPIHLVFHCGLVLVPRWLGVAISSLVATMSVCPVIFVKTCRHWVTRLSLARSGGRSRGSVDIISAAFPTVKLKESHQILVMSNNLLQNFCSSCCNFWCWNFGRGTVYHIHLMLKFGGEADY